MRIAMTLLALGLSMTACKKKETKPTGDMGSGSAMAGSDMGSGSAMAGSDVGSGSAMAGSDTGSGSAMAGSGDAPSMTKKAGNCPSTVFGSTTKSDTKGKDVVVTITSTDKDAIVAIQKRTTELLAEKKDNATGGGHDQKGTHGGGTGICPVYLPEGATAKAKNDKTGVIVTITPKDKPEDLKKEVDARITKADEWVKANIKPGDKANQGGVGGGKGAHGANHSGEGDAKGKERKAGEGKGKGGGEGTGGGGGKGTGGGSGSGKGSGSATK